ncbi:hypothetical protein [Streptomyces sp. AC550_RSS872]|uniref:hypothetical protein n=1 Tax=Streptomyces sp. AC550_RSS872 TaxID=2823689 RepID=UPI001C27FAEE|nr:hypothetical protein [Streptomyces sp. AC550_RSS872]
MTYGFAARDQWAGVKAITDYQALALDLHLTLVLWQRVRELPNTLSVYSVNYLPFVTPAAPARRVPHPINLRVAGRG